MAVTARNALVLQHHMPVTADMIDFLEYFFLIGFREGRVSDQLKRAEARTKKPQCRSRGFDDHVIGKLLV